MTCPEPVFISFAAVFSFSLSTTALSPLWIYVARQKTPAWDCGFEGNSKLLKGGVHLLRSTLEDEGGARTASCGRAPEVRAFQAPKGKQ